MYCMYPPCLWGCLSPGGGWQDQVGGLVGGVKVGRSRAALPLRVEVERLTPSQRFLEEVQRHLLLVYTGKTRLARNLLQVGLHSNLSQLGLHSNLSQVVLHSNVLQVCLHSNLLQVDLHSKITCCW